MRLEQLEYFSAIARYKSMNLASEKLHVSQQTLSMSIKKMEDELDVQLLVRSHLGVSLTAEGEEFLKIAETFMRNIVNFKGKYTKKKTDIAGKLSLYATPAICASVLPVLVTMFIQQYPDVEIRIIEKSSAEINQAFESDHSDYKIMAINVMMCEGAESDAYRFSKDIAYQEFLSERYVVMAAKNSVLAEYKTVSINTLLNYPIVVCGADDKEKSLSYLLLTQWGQPIVCMASSNPFVYLQAIRTGVGVGMISEVALQNEGHKLLTEQIHIIDVKEKIESVNYWGVPLFCDNKLIQTFIRFAENTRQLFLH